jgi:hypothetical protein
MQTDVDGYRVGLNQSLEGETWGKGNGWVYICGAPHGGNMGAWERPEGSGARSRGSLSLQRNCDWNRVRRRKNGDQDRAARAPPQPICDAHPWPAMR